MHKAVPGINNYSTDINDLRGRTKLARMRMNSETKVSANISEHSPRQNTYKHSETATEVLEARGRLCCRVIRCTSVSAASIPTLNGLGEPMNMISAEMINARSMTAPEADAKRAIAKARAVKVFIV
jgi:hypothetical protein